jgi:DNA-binding protein Fis
MGFSLRQVLVHQTYVENQKQAAEMLGIKNGSKKAISEM